MIFKSIFYLFFIFSLLASLQHTSLAQDVLPQTFDHDFNQDEKIALDLAIYLSTFDFQSLQTYSKQNTHYLSVKTIINLSMQEYAKIKENHSYQCRKNIWQCYFHHIKTAKKLGLIDSIVFEEIKKIVDPQVKTSGQYDIDVKSTRLGKYLYIYHHWYHLRKQSFLSENPYMQDSFNQNYFLLDRIIFQQNIFKEKFKFQGKENQNTLEHLIIHGDYFLKSSNILPTQGIVNFASDYIVNPKRLMIRSAEFNAKDPIWDIYINVIQIHAHVASLQGSFLIKDPQIFNEEKSILNLLIQNLKNFLKNPTINDEIFTYLQELGSNIEQSNFEVITENVQNQMSYYEQLDNLIVSSGQFLDAIIAQYIYEKQLSTSDQFNLKYNKMCIESFSNPGQFPNQKYKKIRVLLGKSFLMGEVGHQDILTILNTNGFFLPKNNKFLKGILTFLSYAAIPMAIIDTSQITTILMGTLRSLLANELSKREDELNPTFKLVPRIPPKECVL